ncbi:MAG: HEPN domain-containing protein [Nitrososphaerales archaeon]
MESLKVRAKGFYETSEFLMKKGDYALAAFNVEQAVQLELKSLPTSEDSYHPNSLRRHHLP